MPSLRLWDQTDLHLFKATKCLIFNYLNWKRRKMLQLGVSLLCSGPVNLLLFPKTNLEQFNSSVIIFGGMNKIKKKTRCYLCNEHLLLSLDLLLLPCGHLLQL